MPSLIEAMSELALLAEPAQFKSELRPLSGVPFPGEKYAIKSASPSERNLSRVIHCRGFVIPQIENLAGEMPF